MRSAHHLSGRFNSRAQNASTTSSGYSPVFIPKPPPTSPTSTRTLSCAMPSTASHSASRRPVGVWLRGAKRDASARGVVAREQRARLDRARRQPLIDEVERDDVRGVREGLGGRGDVAMADLRRDVAGGRRPHLRRAGRDRGAGVDHARQRVVAHVDGFHRVARRVARLGDDRRHGFADEAHGVDGERMARRRRRRRAVGAPEVRGGRQRLHAGAHEVGAGHDGDDARHRGRGLRVDAENARVRIRRAQEQHVRLPRQL